MIAPNRTPRHGEDELREQRRVPEVEIARGIGEDVVMTLTGPRAAMAAFIENLSETDRTSFVALAADASYTWLRELG